MSTHSRTEPRRQMGPSWRYPGCYVLLLKEKIGSPRRGFLTWLRLIIKARVLAVGRSVAAARSMIFRVELWLLADGWIKGQIFCRNVRWSTFFLVAFSSCSLTNKQMLADYRVRMNLYDSISYRCWCVCDLMLFQWTRGYGWMSLSVFL